ncbi:MULTISPECIES: hypothetical protein [Methylobacterium]|uniref:hypothetical protein n=1 Tax=Methylobacterium TaxID=407 RepID=UPI0008DFE3AA|nr:MULTISPECIES: hypothetical protein [Methylobacterium]MBZ6415979.1 hypothetical protein [Methylobacterium sp.]MBK3399381.1 hypothetical protein [Methylobacterium ajmalii]MBK3412554.1 hypothetical protein [Methylobacterium ajmalii]MBK3423148.1 hypothetical protein [Methylobacterium ajmalii]SFF63770.1 TIGR02646 family protein [Methylobacterium sp. yr596]
MRHVDLDRAGAALPEGWETRAAAALAEVATAPPDKRSAAINKYRTVWRELAPVLSQLSHSKCWYCEARENRSDKAIDHFRPKAKPVEADDTHPGYWWRAFDWKNFRYSCTFCNSRRVNVEDGTGGGKHDHFPLLIEDARAFDESGIDGENPTLLDPIKPGDTTLLYFNEEGRVESRISKTIHAIHWLRANTSIELYHLNHKEIVEDRISLFNSIKSLVGLGKICFDNWQAGNAAAEASYNFVVGRLTALLQEQAEFSTAARDMVRGFRDDRHPWIDGIL